MIDINTSPQSWKDPWEYARKVFIRLLLAGAFIMTGIAYTDHQSGLTAPFDRVMLPVLATVTFLAALIIAWAPQRYMKRTLAVNAALLIFYYEGDLFQAAHATDAASIYSLASTAQFLPGLYIALFVFLNRHAALASWLLYGSVVAQCAHGLLTGDPKVGALQHQIYLGILASHPCCILVLSFMTHLRRMVEDAQHESLSAKERFLAIVSHEIRSPLQTIVTSLELVEKAPPGPILDRAIRRVMGAANLLELQIRDLTAFTKLELTPELTIGEVDLLALAITIEQTQQIQAARRGLTLTLELPSDGLSVLADGPRLRQIVDNLIGNALKYTASGGVTVGVRREQDNGLIHWWVKDTGRGIAADQVARVFEPFVRVKSHPQERIEGSGLGLAVVRQLVGLMNGKIQVDSTPGQGTTVHLKLPLPVVANAAAIDSGLRPDAVLVADDDADILQSIMDLLTALGVREVIGASDGLTAIQMLQTRPVDLAFVDLQMPGASGYKVAHLTRQSGANAHTPLIAMSAVALDKAMPGAGIFAAYLPKPVGQAQLVQVMAQARSEPLARESA